MDIKLTNDEALVLFEFLSRSEESGSFRIEHQSEQKSLWNLSALLEKQLSEPFSSNYKELLKTAQSNILNS